MVQERFGNPSLTICFPIQYFEWFSVDPPLSMISWSRCVRSLSLHLYPALQPNWTAGMSDQTAISTCVTCNGLGRRPRSQSQFCLHWMKDPGQSYPASLVSLFVWWCVWSPWVIIHLYQPHFKKHGIMCATGKIFVFKERVQESIHWVLITILLWTSSQPERKVRKWNPQGSALQDTEQRGTSPRGIGRGKMMLVIFISSISASGDPLSSSEPDRDQKYG